MPAVSLLSSWSLQKGGMRPRLPIAIALLAAAAPFLSTPSQADGRKDDAERALRESRAGEIMPFARLAQIVLERYPGRVVEADLDEDDGRMIYEIRILQGNGRVLEVEVDAATGRILDVDEDD
jgi:uncharacterized membrane protein YkoI